MGMSAGGAASGVKAEPNVTPMIDVMLVLLIIFMIVIPTITSGFNAVPPQGINLKQQPEDDKDQVLGLDATGTYYLNKQPIRKEDLETALRQIFDDPTRGDYVLYVKAHKDLEFGKVQEALDIAALAGVRRGGMISEQVPNTESTIPGDILNTNPLSAPPPAGGPGGGQ
jgi:biopolymer transport protein ExbD